MKMKKILIGLILIGLIFFYESEIFAHGVGYRQSKFRAIPLEFFYSTGEKMSYREAKVFSPKDSKFAAQTGRTDEEGRFAFIPDCVGEWRVIVRDEEGHQCTAELDVAVNDNEKVSVPKTQADLAARAILGVSIIFNIAMIIRSRHAH